MRRTRVEVQTIYLQLRGAHGDDDVCLARWAEVVGQGTGAATDPTATWYEVRPRASWSALIELYERVRESGMDVARVARLQAIRAGDGSVMARQLALVADGTPAVVAAPAAGSVGADRTGVRHGRQLTLFGK